MGCLMYISTSYTNYLPSKISNHIERFDYTHCEPINTMAFLEGSNDDNPRPPRDYGYHEPPVSQNSPWLDLWIMGNQDAVI